MCFSNTAFALFSCVLLLFCEFLLWSRAGMELISVCVCVFLTSDYSMCSCVFSVSDADQSLSASLNQAGLSLQEMKRTRTFSKTSPRWHQTTRTNSTATDSGWHNHSITTSAFFYGIFFFISRYFSSHNGTSYKGFL